MASMVSKSPSPPPYVAARGGGGGNDDAAEAAHVHVTSRLYLNRPEPGAGPLEKDAVLGRIRHRRRANRLRDTLSSLLLRQREAAEKVDGGERAASWLDDAFLSP